MRLISIITPVKNASAWLDQCLISVQNQSFSDWEWIIINDHSEDDSETILKKAQEQDQRIKVYNAVGHGVIPALQQALEHCTGTYLTRMDADDLMPIGRLQLMVSELEKCPPQSVVTGLSKYISENPISDGYQKYQQWLNANLLDGKVWNGLYRECVIASPNWLVRTEELLAIGGFNGLIYPEDYDLCFRWYAKGFEVKCIPEVTLLWREHPTRTSRNSQNYSQQAFFDLKIERFLQLDYQSEKQLCLWGTGTKARITAKILRRNKLDYTHMVLDKAESSSDSSTQSYAGLEQMPAVQILIAVYPPSSERKKIETYLESLRLKEGVDYWYL